MNILGNKILGKASLGKLVSKQASKLARVPLTASLAVLLALPVQTLGQGVLEEVVVTAQKREQSLQDTAVAVTAISGDDLSVNSITDITKLEVMAPGMQFGQSGGDPRPAMRGARTQQVEANDVAIAFYTDGLYRPRHGQALAGFVDVDRVEVLRGPQGTLFGRNSLGGLIHVISNKPDFGGTDYGFGLTVGDYSQVRTEGYFNTALNDSAALRIAAVRETRDPYVENIAIGDKGGLKDADMSYFRTQVALAPSEDINVTLRTEHWKDDSNGNGDFGYKVLGVPVNLDTGKTNGTTGTMRPRIGRSNECTGTCGRAGAGFEDTSPGGMDTAVPTIDNPYTINRDSEPARNVEESTFAMDIDWSMGFSDAKLTLGYMDYEELRLADGDLSPNAVIFSGNDITSETTSVELQFTSNSDGPVDWVVGAYFFQEDLKNAFLWQDLSYLENNAPRSVLPQGNPNSNRDDMGSITLDDDGEPNVPEALRPAWASWMNEIRMDTESLAYYAQMTYSITDSLRVTAGARHTSDEREWDIYGQDPNNPATPVFSVLEVDGANESWSKTTWKAGVEYDFSEDLFVYAHTSTGFLAGNAQGAFEGSGTYDEQTVVAYEIGSKLLLGGGSMILNTSLYLNEYEDLLSTRFRDANGTTLAFSANAGEISALGLEVELDWLPSENLRLGARVAFQQAEYGDFITPNVYEEGGKTLEIDGVTAKNQFDLDGEQVQLSPDLTATLLGSYDIHLNNGTIIRPAITMFYSDEYRADDALFFYAEQDSFTKTDLSLTWLSGDQLWSVRAFVNNVEDEATLTKATRYGGDVAIADYAIPRTWGLSLRYNF